ncbi:MAG: hypothetical protein RIC52_05045 [Amphiplicatus sp.]
MTDSGAPAFQDATSSRQASPSASPLTVVVVSDFEAGADKTWRDERRMVEALARQDIDIPFNVLFVESEANRSEPPRDLLAPLASARIVYGPAEESALLKSFGASQTDAPLIAVFEADAAPNPCWLRLLYQRAAAHPEYSVFSGRTTYGDETSWKRVLSLLDRSFDDYGCACESRHISSNAALYRAQVLKDFPYAPAPTPFVAARQRDSKIAEAGLRKYFDREAVTTHEIGGLDFAFLYRRNSAHASMTARYSKSWASIPAELILEMRSEVGSALRVGKDYLRWYDWPLWLVMFGMIRIPEVIGMIDALKKVERIPGSAYR